MEPKSHDTHAILMRIESLERHNLRLKRTALAMSLVVALVILAGALSAEDQQGQATTKRPDWVPATQQWRMPDGRVVEFPASTSKDEIDALAERIADGAVELPHGARVVGWEPVEGTTSLLPDYAQRLATIPTAKGKLDALANAAGILQSQIVTLRMGLDAERSGNAAAFKSADNAINNHADSLQALAGEVAYLEQQEQMRRLQPNADDVRRKLDELEEFKDAACPVLRTARMDDFARIKLNSVCGLQ